MNQWDESTYFINILKLLKLFNCIPFGGGFGDPEKDHVVVCGNALHSFAMDSPHQLNVFRHYGYTPSMYGTQICVLKQ